VTYHPRRGCERVRFIVLNPKIGGGPKGHRFWVRQWKAGPLVRLLQWVHRVRQEREGVGLLGEPLRESGMHKHVVIWLSPLPGGASGYGRRLDVRTERRGPIVPWGTGMQKLFEEEWVRVVLG